MQPDFIRLPEVMRRTGLKRSTIYKMMVVGTFPKAISIGVRCVGWSADEIQDWILAKLEARAA